MLIGRAGQVAIREAAGSGNNRRIHRAFRIVWFEVGAAVQGQLEAAAAWYSEQMQPEFRALFQLAMSQCYTRVPAPRPKQVGLVFTVEQDGSVGRVFWQERSAFTDCLEDFLRNALFPRPPQPVFYFGIEAELPEDQQNP